MRLLSLIRFAVSWMTAFLLLRGQYLWAAEQVPIEARLFPWVTELVLAASALSLVAALIAFKTLTRHLRMLASALAGFRRDGCLIPLRLGFADTQGDELQRIAAALQEMSERVASQLQQVTQIDTHRRELLANVSHDLRTPLASMQGYLDILLLRRGTLSSEEERSYLEVAAKHTERLGKLVDDLFKLTKFDAKEVQLDAEPFPLTELAQDIVQKFQLAAERRGLCLETVLREDTPPVIGDIGMIERVLENLIENAMRHTSPNGVVRVHVEPAGERVVLRVADTGHGISSEELPHVFDRYYRGDRGEAVDAGNVGLGLAITQRIVTLHGGSIKVDSTVGRGTTFSFDLPLAPLPAP